MEPHATAPGPDHAHEHEPMPEGEEQAPPGTRAMAVVRWMLVAGMAALATVSITSYVRAAHGPSSSANLHHCPMHPSVIQDHPGDCPICGMSLVLVSEAAKAEPKTEAPKAGHEGHRHNPDDPYVCPMCPEETSDDPKARCPVCKMFLKPRKDQGVPGLAPVELSTERIQLAGIRTAKVEVRTLASELRTVGTLAAPEDGLARIPTRFAGWIEQVFVNQTGDRVEKGQVLATIYSPELLTAQQEFLTARRWTAQPGSPGAALEADARRKLELLGVSEPEIAEVEKTGVPLRAMKLRSPARGVVTLRAAVPGLYVQPGAELFQVADLSRVWLLADVYEAEIGRVALGQSARLSLVAYPGEAFTGKVQFISPTLDSQTRTLRVRLDFKNPGLRLKPGMFGDVTLDLGSAQGLVVPAEALVDTGDHQYVFLARDAGRFEPRRVKAGRRHGPDVQILEGVSPGDVVVTTANFLVDSESRLRSAIEGMTRKAAGHSH